MKSHPTVDAGEKHADDDEAQYRPTHHAENAEGNLQHRLPQHASQIGQPDSHQPVDDGCREKI
jgi:hypothetical protein